MFHKRERVLAVIVFATLYCKVAAVTKKHLDMALDAVDDQYNGCRDQVLEKVVKSGLLTEELNRNGEFQKAWNANTQCSKLISGGVKEHTSALLTYGDSKFRETFNDAVETMGGNASVYESNFPYKSLHFLLMDSMKLLNNGTCKTVYRISKQKYIVQKGLKFRFGRFTLATNADLSDLKEDPDLDKGMLFIINSCSGINLAENTCNQGGEDIELLISPAEVFTVIETKQVTLDYDYTEVVLKHEGFHSYHDCYLFPRLPNGSSTQTLGTILLVFMALSALLFIC